MSRVLCKIHSVDLKAAGLEDCGKHGEHGASCLLCWCFLTGPLLSGFGWYQGLNASAFANCEVGLLVSYLESPFHFVEVLLT